MNTYLRLLSVALPGLLSAGCLTIPQGFGCDGSDGSCPSGQSCVSDVCVADGGGGNDFLCLNGTSIPQDQVCNFIDNCGDGSDESESLCGRPVSCADMSGVTIYSSQVCDLTENCPGDGSVDFPAGKDEAFCMECLGSAQLTNNLLHCDGIEDCDNGFDEIHCFPCGPGENIRMGWVCDGFQDCGDNRDEMGCVDFLCTDMALTTIPAAGVCDGNEFGLPECPDGSDESDAPPTSCSLVAFDCTDGSATIPQGWLCDGWPDCDDQSDENPVNCYAACPDGSRVYPPTMCPMP